MRAAVGLMDGLGLDSDWCIRVIPRHYLFTFTSFNLVMTDIEILRFAFCRCQQTHVDPFNLIRHQNEMEEFHCVFTIDMHATMKSLKPH